MDFLSSGAHKRFGMVRCRRYGLFFYPTRTYQKAKAEISSFHQGRYHNSNSNKSISRRIRKIDSFQAINEFFFSLFWCVVWSVASMVIRGHKLVCFMCCSKKRQYIQKENQEKLQVNWPPYQKW